MPKVWNKRDKNVPADAVYIGRPSRFGNPFVIGKDGTRADVVRKYREYLLTPNNVKLREAVRIELKNKDVICFCAPQACHGDVLIEVANS